MKMKELIKKHWKLPVGIISGFFLSILLVKAVDTIYFHSENVSYSNTNSGLEATKVQDAIDELYTRYDSLWCRGGYDKGNEDSDSYTCEKPPICKAVANASDLHTETCSQTSTSQYCSGDGYTENGSKGTTTITYGTLWDGVSALKAGDAFDCDVNGNGIIDKENGISTERFYYVSDRWNEGTDIDSFDTTTGVLIYYKNFVSEAASDNEAAYATQAAATDLGYTCTETNGCNWYGPLTAVTHLPKTTGTNAWRSDLLTTRSRTIYACDNANCSNTPVLTTNGGTITPNPFNYGSTTAARLLTVAEVAKGCKAINGNTPLSTTGSLSACNFLFEGTQYANSSKATYGPWLETPSASYSHDAWSAGGRSRNVSTTGVNNTSRGVRPVIEIPKTLLEPPPPICKAVTNASDLHTETCSQSSDYCYADGYYAGGSKGTTTITYGTIWDGSSALKAGDAFDCDVNGNGIIDKVDGVSTERFYYVSDYFNTQNQTFDTTTGVLIYYKNFVNRVASDNGAAYDLNTNNWHGPVTAVTHLPLVSGANAWRSDLLKTNTRAILAEYRTTHNATSTSGGTLPTAFEYKNSSNVATAARLLTAQEVMRGCNLTQLNGNTAGELSGCNFLFEGTQYASSNKATIGPWFETPHASDSYYAWSAYGINRNAYYGNVYYTTRGVRPTIDVAKSKIAR